MNKKIMVVIGVSLLFLFSGCTDSDIQAPAPEYKIEKEA